MPHRPLAERVVVLDLETSGLDSRRDHIIAIGAVAIRGALIDLSDSFEAVLQGPLVSARDNILIHQIGAEAQLKGGDPATTLARFRDFLAGAPLVAWHAGFDRDFLRRAWRQHLRQRLSADWLDLAVLAPQCHPQAPAQGQSLEGWLKTCGGAPEQELHVASLDALMAAQLYLALQARLPAGQRSFRELLTRVRQRRWLG